MPDTIAVTREVTKFSKQSEQLEGEFDITHLPLSVLQQLFAGALPEDPLLQCVHKITADQAAALQQYITEPFDFGGYDYFLEAFEAEGRQTASAISRRDKSALQSR